MNCQHTFCCLSQSMKKGVVDWAKAFYVSPQSEPNGAATVFGNLLIEDNLKPCRFAKLFVDVSNGAIYDPTKRYKNACRAGA